MRKLKDRLAQLEAEHARTGMLVEHYRQVIDDLESLGEEELGSSPSSSIGDAMEQILRKDGSPKHYRNIYELLKASGTRVNGADPIKNTGAHLSADERFESLGAGMWGLAEWRKNSPDWDQSDDLPF